MKIWKCLKKVIKLVDVGAPNLCGHLKDGGLEACDRVCGKTLGREVKELLGSHIMK